MSGTILVVCEDQEFGERYAAALRAVGVASEAIRLLHPGSGGDPVALAEAAAGIVMCGGDDLEPWRFGEEPLAGAKLALVPDQDALDWTVLDVARRRRIPTFAICRGLQVLNVLLGGTLWQDIPMQAPSDVNHNIPKPREALAHTVRALPGEGWLFDLLGPEPRWVNSRHHQALRRLAPDLVPVAASEDGLVEAVVGRDPGWWLAGVQWHPENLTADELQLALWRAFRDAVRDDGHRREAARTAV